MATMDNLLLGDLHGSISGLTFYGSPGKQKVRMKTKPITTISENLRLNQLIMGQVSRQWQFLDTATKSLWATFAATYYHPHEATPHYPYNGFQAFCGCYKMWLDTFYKLVPFTYFFDANPPVSPVSVSLPAFSLTPPTADYFGDLCYTDLTNVPITCSKLEIIQSNHVKFQLDYTHNVPPPALENDWLTFDGQNIMFAVWCSEAVPFMNAIPKNVIRYYLGCTGYVVNPASSLDSSSSCTFELDCSSVITNNSSFPGKASYLWIGIDRLSSAGTFSGLFTHCTNKALAFSF